jgi:hypothetical protein
MEVGVALMITFHCYAIGIVTTVSL